MQSFSFLHRHGRFCGQDCYVSHNWVTYSIRQNTRKKKDSNQEQEKTVATNCGCIEWVSTLSATNDSTKKTQVGVLLQRRVVARQIFCS